MKTRISRRKKGYALEWHYERPVWVDGMPHGSYVSKSCWNTVGRYRFKWLAKLARWFYNHVENAVNKGWQGE